MGDMSVALIGAAVGLLGVIWGTLTEHWSKKDRDAEFADLIAQRQRVLEEIAAESGLSADQAREFVRRTSFLLSDYVEDYDREFSRARRPADVKHSRKKSEPRVVEVRREDGSIDAIGVDPSNAASVGEFLDAIRPERGERVLAVH